MTRHCFVGLLTLIVALGSFSCAAFRDYYLDPAGPTPPEVGEVLVLPLNFDSTPAPVLATGVDLMLEMVTGHLEDEGLVVGTLRLSTVTGYWKEETEKLGGVANKESGKLDEERYETARAAVARRALEQSGAAVVVVPTLLIRKARFFGRTVMWDGVTRPVVFEFTEAAPSDLTPRGEDAATSLRITIYDRSGRRIFERCAGLETAIRYVLKSKTYQRVPRNDLFRDPALLDEGVRLAFVPWLANPAAAGE